MLLKHPPQVLGRTLCFPVPSKGPSHPDHLYIVCFEAEFKAETALNWGLKG